MILSPFSVSLFFYLKGIPEVLFRASFLLCMAITLLVGFSLRRKLIPLSTTYVPWEALG